VPLATEDRNTERVAEKSLLQRLESAYFRDFLPVVYSPSYAQRMLRPYAANREVIRTWTGKSGKVVAFYPPPPGIKIDPAAKPDRLGRVIKRLAWCYRRSLKQKVEMANDVLDSLLAATPNIAVAFSGGRDSLVALHLILQRRPDVPVMLVNTNIEFPESLSYVRWLAEVWQLNYHEANAHVNFWRLSQEQGIPVAGRGNTTFMKDLAQKADVRLSNSCCRRMKETPARQFYKAHAIEGVVTGLRVQESLMRKLNFADYGALRYTSTYDTLNSWPLYAWTEHDINDYIELHNLPMNPIYGMGYNRVGCWACLQDMFHKDSRLFTLREKHPQLYETVSKKFGPQMIRLLSAWAELDNWDFEEVHLDGLYRACTFELLEEHRAEKRRRSRQAKHQEVTVSIDDSAPSVVGDY
jgi:3'-phosphoadenosine 5'-phosphosulfate sulfotransferase (PAPS reductase)/FAD synthetase